MKRARIFLFFTFIGIVLFSIHVERGQAAGLETINTISVGCGTTPRFCDGRTCSNPFDPCRDIVVNKYLFSPALPTSFLAGLPNLDQYENVQFKITRLNLSETGTKTEYQKIPDGMIQNDAISFGSEELKNIGVDFSQVVKDIISTWAANPLSSQYPKTCPIPLDADGLVKLSTAAGICTVSKIEIVGFKKTQSVQPQVQPPAVQPPVPPSKPPVTTQGQSNESKKIVDAAKKSIGIRATCDPVQGCANVVDQILEKALGKDHNSNLAPNHWLDDFGRRIPNPKLSDLRPGMEIFYTDDRVGSGIAAFNGDAGFNRGEHVPVHVGIYIGPYSGPNGLGGTITTQHAVIQNFSGVGHTVITDVNDNKGWGQYIMGAKDFSK